MYKLLQMKGNLTIGNAVYRVDTEELLEFEEFDYGGEPHPLIEWLKENNYPEDSYLVCEYDDARKYVKTVGVVFFHPEPDPEYDIESFVDCAEWDYRVMGDVANNKVARRYLNQVLLKGIKEFGLEGKVASLINEEIYKKL